jgi:hypothetical protein
MTTLQITLGVIMGVGLIAAGAYFDIKNHKTDKAERSINANAGDALSAERSVRRG